MIEVACGIMKNKDGKILMGLRPHSKIKTGIWEFPGGKLEENENIVECYKKNVIDDNYYQFKEMVTYLEKIHNILRDKKYTHMKEIMKKVHSNMKDMILRYQGLV